MNEAEVGGADEAAQGNGHSKPAPKNKVKHKPRRPQVTKALKERELVVIKIMAMIAMGYTRVDIVEQANVSKATVDRVRAALPQEYLDLLEAAKTNEIAQLIEENLRETLASMIRITRITNNEAWLIAQRAPELATLYGVFSDKTVRVLAAIERANERDRYQRPQVSPSDEIVRPAEAPLGA
jgi:hypothetical protein